MSRQDGVPLLFDKKNTVLFVGVTQKAVRLQVTIAFASAGRPSALHAAEPLCLLLICGLYKMHGGHVCDVFPPNRTIRGGF